MNVVLICKCDLENKLIVNLVYKNLVNKYKKNIKIDLLFTNKEKAEFNSVFFEREKFNNVLFFEFSVNFYKQVKKEKYDKIIDISNSLIDLHKFSDHEANSEIYFFSIFLFLRTL